MKNVAFITDEAYAGLVEQCQPIIAALAEQDITAGLVPIHSAPETFATYDALLLNTCSGYHENPEPFLKWLNAREKEGTAIYNPPSVIRWNLDKFYLRELEKKGATLIPTVWAEKDKTFSLAGTMNKTRWEKVVMKPTISAGAAMSHVVTRENAEALQKEAEKILSHSGLMLQPFLPEIVNEGEWSLLFFNRAPSHTVIKHPAKGDWRVQHVHGGSYRAAEAPAALVNEAVRILENIEGDLLYARVDGVMVNGQFLLMEVEAFEPYLYMDAEPSSFRRFADAIVSKVYGSLHTSLGSGHRGAA